MAKRKRRRLMRRVGNNWIEKFLFLFFSGLAVLTVGMLFLTLRKVKKVEIIGYENLPDEGNVVLAPNHPSMAETVLIPLMPLFKSWWSFHRFLKDPFKWAPWSTPDEWWLRLIPPLKYLHCIPVRNQRVDRTALREAKEILWGQGIIVLFIEGTRTGKLEKVKKLTEKQKGKRYYFLDKGSKKEKKVRKPRLGIGSMQMSVQPKIIPIWVDGAEEVQPIGQAFPNFFGKRKITISIGKEIDFQFTEDLESSKRSSSVISEKVAKKILAVAESKE